VLEPKEIQALKELNEKKFLEFCGTYYNYKGRNTGLSLADILPLSYNNYIEEDYDAWHTTYRLTEFGKKVAKELD
jgi:hypothetical protein